MACPRCAEQDHDLIRCPYVKAVEFNSSGTIKRVEFLTPADHIGGDNEKVGAEPGGADEQQADYPRKGSTGG